MSGAVPGSAGAARTCQTQRSPACCTMPCPLATPLVCIHLCCASVSPHYSLTNIKPFCESFKLCKGSWGDLSVLVCSFISRCGGIALLNPMLCVARQGVRKQTQLWGSSMQGFRKFSLQWCWGNVNYSEETLRVTDQLMAGTCSCFVVKVSPYLPMKSSIYPRQEWPPTSMCPHTSNINISHPWYTEIRRWISVMREIIVRTKKRVFYCALHLPAANLTTIRILDFNRGIDLGFQFFQLLFDIGVCPLKISMKLPGLFV